MRLRPARAAFALIFSLAAVEPVSARPAAANGAMPEIVELSVDDLDTMMAKGTTSSAAITAAYLARIAAIDRKGPTLRSVIAVNPNALAEAKAMDAERAAGHVRGPLHGIPVLVKDNIETRDQPTTAGSLALIDNDSGRDAPVIARLRAAGAVILGKTNLSEWANIRSSASMSGWSAVGGLVRNPYALDRSSCGSSSGTGAAIAASLGAVGLGTETDGSVVCPSSMNGLVGLKPTLGAVSRTHVVPISHSQDTPGPMGRTVRDVAILFGAMTGSDPADRATADADVHRTDFAAGLSAGALKGLRIAVLHPDAPDALKAVYAAQLETLQAQGAVLVDAEPPKTEGMGDAEFDVLKMELKSDLDVYLAGTPKAVKTRSLADVIAFDAAHSDTEMLYFGQEIFEAAEATGGTGNPAYAAARAKSLKLASGAIDAMLKAADAAMLVEPTYGMAWLSDSVYGDHFEGPGASDLPAISGYPHLTVPMGLVKGLPVGMSFIGPRWSEAMLLGAGYAYEQAAKARVVPGYAPTLEVGSGIEGMGR